ncbi:MAG: U32 family peptidase [Clostridia bacterium]|nr:U32 family peptidase [Clostridia bacterium]
MPELLSPAGNFEKLETALLYGADAVYLAGQSFGMRSQAGNFTVEELYKAVDLAHSMGKKVYLTLNTMPRTHEYPALYRFLDDLRGCALDAMIIADLGVLATVKEMLPGMEIHISTQASIISPAAARAYAALGAKRLVLARELQFSEIRAIKAALPSDIELEAFIHGSMCVSYSGRCLLANMMNGRDGNRGTCSQPCRWHYHLIEEKRPDFPIPIEQDDQGTFILSSKDMCMIEHIPELMESGIDSFKIEGRMKSSYYTAVVTNTYRMAIDAYKRDPAGYRFDPAWMDELESVSHREYATGFYLDDPMKQPQLVQGGHYIQEKAYYGTAIEYDTPEALAELELIKARGIDVENCDGRLYRFREKNRVMAADRAEIISPGHTGRFFYVGELYDTTGCIRASVPHPEMTFWARVPHEVTPGDIMRVGKDKR